MIFVIFAKFFRARKLFWITETPFRPFHSQS